MPYVCQKIRLSKEQDRRIKLTDKQRIEISELYDLGMSQHTLAREFKVSRRLINFILFPENFVY